MKYPDQYHTCYASSGLSIAQSKSDFMALHSGIEGVDVSSEFDGIYKDTDPSEKGVFLAKNTSNRVRRINPIFNVRYDYLARAKSYFNQKTQ